MPRHYETNPHFDPSQNQDQRFQSPHSRVAAPRRQDQQNQPIDSRASPHLRPDQQNRPVGPSVTAPWPQDQQNQPLGSLVSQPQHRDQQIRPPGPLERGPQQPRQPRHSPWFSGPWRSPSGPRVVEPQRQDQHTQPPSSPAPRTKKPKRQDRHNQPLGAWAMLPEHHDEPIQPSGPQAAKPKEALPQQPDQHSQPQGPQMLQPPQQGQHRQPQSHETFQPQRHGQHSRQHGLRVPSPRRTKLLTWFLAGFCAIFWIVIILGGLIVLIVYLIFRPHNPQFDVSGVTLNAAYLDMDLLNADLTVLANFTNPNKKVKVDFSYVVLDLYYGSTLIASQYVEPFSAARSEYKLQDVHLVTSQVRLPVAEIEHLKKQISTNAVVFKIKGVFRARSNLGSLLRYSYRLYGTCVVMVNGPPSGVIRAKKCKTKR
ncbi:hypothetical protein ACOSP7_018480 [Xanthoceras sorbifolium]